MRLHVLSDLHLEFASLEIPDTDADAVVLAGDIGNGTQGLHWAIDRWAGSGRPIVYVAGNHEFYGHDLNDMRQELLAMTKLARDAGTPVWVLDNEALDLPGLDVRFLGTTLWTNYTLLGDAEAAMQRAKTGLNDHRQIRQKGAFFSPQDALVLHRQSVQWLEAQLLQPFSGRTVVVTHHAPSILSILPRYRDHPLSAAFASNLDPLLELADLWIHGHTHFAYDYKLGRCRVVCNPRGYDLPGRTEKTGFSPTLMVPVL